MISTQTNQIDDSTIGGRSARLSRITAALAAATAMVLPAGAYSAGTPSKPAAQHAQKKGSLKIKHQRSPSEETTAERDRRLKRECKGAPNAGACLGYTGK